MSIRFSINCPSPAESKNNALGSILVIGAIVGLIVWAVTSKKNKTADTSLEAFNPVAIGIS